MKLGGAIPPVIPDADELVSDGESAAVLREILAGLAHVTQALVGATTRLGALIDQHQSSTESLASSARLLAHRTTMPAPRVDVTVPSPTVNVPTPSVTVEIPKEDEGPEILEVERDANGLITRVVKRHG